MCDSKKRVEELEIEISEIHRNYAEARKLDEERGKLSAEKDKLILDAMKQARDIKYQPLLLITPMIVSLIALIAAIAK